MDGGAHVGAPRLVGAIGVGAAALALALVPVFEGTVRTGYRDIAGVVTACAGHTATAVFGRRYTDEQCRALLDSDLTRHAQGLPGCVPGFAALPDHVRAATLSWAFNVGTGAACGSTLVRRLNAGDAAGACAELSRWTYVRGRNCAAPEWSGFCGGIVRRRAAERAMCEGRYHGA